MGEGIDMHFFRFSTFSHLSNSDQRNLTSIHSVLAELELKSGFNIALIVSHFTHHGIHDRGTYNRSRSSGEPFNLAILDEEFRKVLPISSCTSYWGICWEGPLGHTQSTSWTGGLEFSFKYFQIGWVSGPFTSPYICQLTARIYMTIGKTDLLCDWESNSVIQLTELKYFIICSRFLCFKLCILAFHALPCFWPLEKRNKGKERKRGAILDYMGIQRLLIPWPRISHVELEVLYIGVLGLISAMILYSSHHHFDLRSSTKEEMESRWNQESKWHTALWSYIDE